MSNYQVHVPLHITSGNSLVFTGNDTSNFVALAIPAVTGTANFVLPIADGTTGQALVTDGSHGLYFTTITTSVATINTASKSVVIADPSSTADYSIWRVPHTKITVDAVHILLTGAAGDTAVGFLDVADVNGQSAAAMSDNATATAGTNLTTASFTANANTATVGQYIQWHTTAGTGSGLCTTMDYTVV